MPGSVGAFPSGLYHSSGRCDARKVLLVLMWRLNAEKPAEKSDSIDLCDPSSSTAAAQAITVEVKPNIKPFLYPFPGVERITMLAGGTGIAPMIQALHVLLTTPGDKTRVRLLYGNLSPADIMLKAELDAVTWPLLLETGSPHPSSKARTNGKAACVIKFTTF